MLASASRFSGKFFLILGCLYALGLIDAIATRQLYAQNDTQQAEQEDLAFIQNLFNDKIYTYAKQESASFTERYADSPLLPNVLFVQAQINVIEGQFDKALRRYNRIISEYPQSPLVESALYFSGALKLQLNLKEGIKDFDRLLAKFPQSKFKAKISFHKGELAFREEDWSTAEGYFKSVLAAEGINDEQRLKTQHYLAWIYYFIGKNLLAKSMFFELLDSKIAAEDKAKIAFQLGVDAQKNKRYKNAITWFERQLNEWPQPDLQPRSRFWVAECYYAIYKEHPGDSTREDKEKAIELYTGNLDLPEPVSPLVSHHHRGWLLMALNREEQAETDFTWLQQNSSEYAADLELTATRASYYEKKNNLAEANKTYISALPFHQEKEVHDMLLISIIRNAQTLGDCDSIIKWKNEADLSAENKNRAEISFYGGRCHFERKEWKKAAQDFARIPLDSQYARVIFANYLQVFKKTGDFAGGMKYLDQVETMPQFGDLEKILLLKVDLSLSMEQWARGIDVMLRLENEYPVKSKDPWFLLNIAKTADQVVAAMGKKNHPIRRYPLKAKSYYADLAFQNYQAAFRLLPAKERETKLSVLDILITRQKAEGGQDKVIALYREAINLIPDKQRQNEIRLLIATMLLKDPKNSKKAQLELHKIHNNGDKEVNFEASTLLAETYVDQKKFVQAIKILEDLSKQRIQKTKWFASTHFRLGELYQANERWQKAIEHYDAVVKSGGNASFKQQAQARSTEIKKYLEQRNKG